jgi:hypothetical protein
VQRLTQGQRRQGKRSFPELDGANLTRPRGHLKVLGSMNKNSWLSTLDSRSVKPSRGQNIKDDLQLLSKYSRKSLLGYV